MTAIINATLVMRDHYIPDAVILLENGVITMSGNSRELAEDERVRKAYLGA